MNHDTECRWGAMATLSPLRRRWAFAARILWRVVLWLNKFGIARPKALTKLSMIGFARWSLVYEVPPKRGIRILEDLRLPKPYILFETNWNGDSDQYFEAFSYVSEKGVSRMWRGTYGMPKVRRVSEFIRFINDNKHKPAEFRTGYPDASAKMIRSSLEVKRLHDELNPRVPRMSDETFLREYTKVLKDAQKQDPPLPPQYKPRLVRKDKETGAFTAITAYDTGRHRKLTDDLALLPKDWAPRTTQFARWIPIEKVMRETLPPKFKNWPPIGSCLVFGAWFDCDRDEYLQQLYAHQKIWCHCDGWDGAGDEEEFKEYLCAHEYEIGMPYSPYDGVPNADIEAAIKLNDAVWSFAAENQELTATAGAGQLKQRWLERFHQ